MNVLEMIKRVLNFQDWKEASSLPGWRPRPTRTKHSRTPFSSSRRRDVGPQHMTVEEFDDKDMRNSRFAELRAKGTPHLSKFSTVRNAGLDADGRMRFKSVWCVVRP